MSDAIARFTVEADWDAEHPLSDAARTAYAEHGTLLLRRFAPADLLARFREEAATMIGLTLGELGLDAAASRLATASTAASISCWPPTGPASADSTRPCASCRASTR